MKQKTYLRWGVTITAAACAILVFYDTFFQDGVLFIFIEKLFGILKPVLYGLAMAYLLTPIVDFFDRLLRDRLGVKRAGLMRCLSILVTWLLALGLVYLLFSILIPELVASVSLLFSNLESYYRTIYTWVTQLVEDNPYISERVLTLVRDYYNELVDWVKNTVIPGAQVAIVAVTGGVLSVLGFADSECTDRRAERAEAELGCSYLAPDDRVFYVGQGDNGEGWFSAVFDFYPFWWITPARSRPTPAHAASPARRSTMPGATARRA